MCVIQCELITVTTDPTMNTKNEVLARLLRLFPAKKIKSQWSVKGSKDDLVADIAKKKSDDEIHQFARDNSGLTKQLISVRSNETIPLAKLPPSILSFGNLISKEEMKGRVEYFYLLDLVYNVILQAPLEKAELHFKWPVKVVFENKHFLIYVTIMEQNVKSYYPLERSAIVATRNLREEDIVFGVCDTLKLDSTKSALDLNKGIKALWDSNLFDAFNTRFKKANSTSSEAMDKGRLLKRDNPQDYAILIRKPLLKTGFVFLTKSDQFPDHFIANPTFGEISIPTYSDDINVSENVIREILKYN